MNNSKLLDMINGGRIEELKSLLQDEVYTEALKGGSGAKKRYTAMKKYFSYTDNAREVLQKPCIVKHEGKDYVSFTNSWSLALTTESCGDIELFDDEERYPNVAGLLRFDGIKKKIDFNKILAEAKSKGYKLKKAELNTLKYKYMLHYDGSYYKMGLIDITYRIIDNGMACITHHPDGERMPLTIENEIGVCMIMPVNIKNKSDMEDMIIIEVE